MPIDTSIYGNIQAPPPVKTFQSSLADIGKLQDDAQERQVRGMQIQGAQRGVADDAIYRQAMQAAQGDPDKAANYLETNLGDPKAAATLREHAAKARQTVIEGAQKHVDTQIHSYTLASQIMSSVTDEPSFQIAKKMVTASLGPDQAAYLGATYDPARVKQAIDMGQTATEKLAQLKEATSSAAAAVKAGQEAGKDAPITLKHWMDAASGTLSLATTPQAWTTAQQNLKAVGAPDAVLQQFGPFDPQAPQRAAKLGLGPAQTVQLAGQAETARHNLATESQGRASLAQTAQLAADKAKAPDDPVGIASDVRTTAGGAQYVNLANYKGKDYGAAQRQAHAAGVHGVSAADADALQNLTTAQRNIEEIGNHLDKLATSPASRLLTGPANKIQAYLQTDDDLAAWGTYRNQAIQAMRAAAGSKGLRINKAEIEMAITNDIPAITDTQAVAKMKMQRLGKLFTSNEQSILGTGPATSPASAPVSTAGGTSLVLPDGSTATFKSGAQLQAFKLKHGL